MAATRKINIVCMTSCCWPCRQCSFASCLGLDFIAACMRSRVSIGIYCMPAALFIYVCVRVALFTCLLYYIIKRTMQTSEVQWVCVCDPANRSLRYGTHSVCAAACVDRTSYFLAHLLLHSQACMQLYIAPPSAGTHACRSGGTACSLS